MGFNTDMSEEEYLRESNFRADQPIPEDVVAEQQKINAADAIVFIYPVFWTEAPAKLVGWFNRVWTFGFAYGKRTMKQLEKGLVICVTGLPLQLLKEYGHYDSYKTVMLGDRMFTRVKEKELIVLDSTSKLEPEKRAANWEKHLKTAYDAGKAL
jgi:NAD(P)H dehydrogenase (quinone)